MIKTVEERTDISSTVDIWEYAIEKELNERWAGQRVLNFTFEPDDSLSIPVRDELVKRYKEAGWSIGFKDYHNGIGVGIETLKAEGEQND